ncbi:M16 family metallopeptidase [Candidatus Omnitrophota bacterium]
MHKVTVLDNGLKVITSRKRDVHSLSLGLWIKTGGRYETKKKQGISHFMEHMLFKGTKKRSCQEIKQAIEQKGGAFNAFTSEECVCYYVKILSKHMNLASDVLTDMVSNSVFKPSEIEKERRVIFEEIRMYLDLPMQHVHDLLDDLIWPNQPLGMSLLGSYETVGSISQKDLLLKKRLFHLPNNITAVASGDIEHDNFVDIISKLFKGQKEGKLTPFKKLGNLAAGSNATFFYKETEQTHICLGCRGLSRQDPKIFALLLLNIILGGNMSSRLFNEIREKRSLAYEIGSSCKQYSDTGSFFVHAGIDNKKVTDAVGIIVNELRKLKKNMVTKKELEMAKEYYRSGLLMAFESTMSNMLFLGEQMTSISRIITREEILEGINNVSVDMIQDVSESLFTKRRLKLAAIGPQDDKEKKQINRLLASV